MLNIELFLSLITLSCLIWAGYEDIKNRLIPDKIWLVLFLISIPGLVYWFFENDDFIARLIVISNIILGIVLGLVFFMLGAFGGGDSKAMIFISISSPFLYTLKELPPTLIMPPIFFILSNMFIYFILFAFILFMHNIYSIKSLGSLFGETNGTLLSKLSILISGRRIRREKIKFLKHEDPAEIYDTKWNLFTPLFAEPLEDEEYEKIEKMAREKAWNDVQNTARTYLWTRPQPPGLLFFVLAYITWLIFGSPVIRLLSN